ncbi:MAG: cupin domain-containing protein [Cyclobacteriaceae bacterium]|nr:cupin domain-containing protein [Cyclobacteriaceae bacterium]
MKPVDYWVHQLGLFPHPEGGFYKEVYRAVEKIPAGALSKQFTAERSISTSIYYLLRSQDRSAFHRIKSDEIWHFYAGTTVLIYVLNDPGLSVLRLGADPERGDSLQVVIRANQWFGAVIEQSGSYALCGCTVAPGFDFADFEMANREELLRTYAEHAEIIHRLT